MSIKKKQHRFKVGQRVSVSNKGGRMFVFTHENLVGTIIGFTHTVNNGTIYDLDFGTRGRGSYNEQWLWPVVTLKIAVH